MSSTIIYHCDIEGCDNIAENDNVTLPRKMTNHLAFDTCEIDACYELLYDTATVVISGAFDTYHLSETAKGIK